MTIPSAPLAGVLRQQKCPICKRVFAVCRVDLLRPDIVDPVCYPEECPDCMDYQIADFPELKDTINKHRAGMHAVAVQFHAACG